MTRRTTFDWSAFPSATAAVPFGPLKAALTAAAVRSPSGGVARVSLAAVLTSIFEVGGDLGDVVALGQAVADLVRLGGERFVDLVRFQAATTLSRTSSSSRSRGAVTESRRTRHSRRRDRDRVVVDADVGVEGAGEQRLSAGQVGDRLAVGVVAVLVDGRDGDAASARISLAISSSVSPPARASSITSRWSAISVGGALVGDLLLDLVLGLVEGLHHLRLDRGDPHDRRPELALDHAADRVGGEREGRVGDLGVDDPLARDQAEVDVRRLDLALGDEVVEGLAAGERGGGLSASARSLKTICSTLPAARAS